MNRFFRWTVVCLLAIATLRAHAEPQYRPIPIGSHVASFTLDHCFGASVSLDDFDEQRAIAIVFLGTECPLAKRYAGRLNELQAKFGTEQLAVIGINSNSQDSLTEIATYAKQHDLQFPMLKDTDHQVANRLGATRTPEVFLLDQEHRLVYRGRIDDQYGIGYAKSDGVQSDLRLAIEQLLSGEKITVQQTESVGCFIGRAQPRKPTGDVTYSKHIAPIFNTHCVSCHRTGEVAPFTLTSYEDVLGWEETILEVIGEERMPPWFADPAHGKFSNDPRLSAEEKDVIRQWIEHGMPPGDPSDLPAAPVFTQGWQIANPDQVIPMRDKPFLVPAQGVVDYQRFIVDPGWDEDKYICAAQARPQNREVVHHILVYIIPPGRREPDLRQVIVGYAPGGIPVQLNDSVALKVDAGSKLLFEMHYTPNGREQIDLSDLGVCFCDPANVRQLIKGRLALNSDFQIPAGQSSHQVQATYRVRQDEVLLSLTPHMHLRGKSFRYEARYPNGTSEVLLDVPRYDFNWQLKYMLAEPKRLPKDTRIECTATFDNSPENRNNPDPNRIVTWGDQSFNEMMIGFTDTLPEKVE